MGTLVVVLSIRVTTASDLPAVRGVHEAAFGEPEGPVIAQLTADLLDDPTAQPVVSLLAFDDEAAAGHVLFTRGRIDGHDGVSAQILAPLAVVPDRQRQGVGERLVERGFELLTEAGCDLVFVLGHPSYYPRFGFAPAGRLGLDAPYPIKPEHAEAWMVTELSAGVLGRVRGTVRCAAALDKPEHWSE